jgi:hypothetical protein
MNLDYVRNEIARLRVQIRRQQTEIEVLKRADVSTASAELLLVRMRAKVDDLCSRRAKLQAATQRKGKH